VFLFLCRHPKYRENLRLLLIGCVQHENERTYRKQLQILVDDLNLNDRIEFKNIVDRSDLSTLLNRAHVGLHTTFNDQFSIGK
jgi:glycosyltransferase involved in cell wall biosynthesis